MLASMAQEGQGDLPERNPLDDVADTLLDKVGRSLAEGPLGDLLKGAWLGHPLHPMLTDLPIGFWTSAVTLDFLAPRSGKRAAQLLMGLGSLSAVPSALAGLTDASTIKNRETRRTAAIHAIGNATVLGCSPSRGALAVAATAVVASCGGCWARVPRPAPGISGDSSRSANKSPESDTWKRAKYDGVCRQALDHPLRRLRRPSRPPTMCSFR